jgi:hypothetical protein
MRSSESASDAVSIIIVCSEMFRSENINAVINTDFGELFLRLEDSAKVKIQEASFSSIV